MTRSIGELEKAWHLRSSGMPYKRIATALGVSVGSAFLWTSDIELTDEQLGAIQEYAGFDEPAWLD
jgi:hypothetical protein